MFPIGVSNFGKLIRHTNSENENYLFVDKSMLIKDFIDAGDEILESFLKTNKTFLESFAYCWIFKNY